MTPSKNETIKNDTKDDILPTRGARFDVRPSDGYGAVVTGTSTSTASANPDAAPTRAPSAERRVAGHPAARDIRPPMGHRRPRRQRPGRSSVEVVQRVPSGAWGRPVGRVPSRRAGLSENANVTVHVDT